MSSVWVGKLVYELYHHKENNVLVAEDLGVSNITQVASLVA